MASRMRIGEVAELFDVTTKTLRHYEKLGLLEPEREENGYRLYGLEDVLRLQRIRQMQSLGLSLKEVARLLGQEDEVPWARVLRSLHEEAAAEIGLLEERMERIERLLNEGLPPDQENLPSTPGKVDEYLEQHLPQASLAAWRRDNRIYASLHSYLAEKEDLHAGIAAQWPFAPTVPGQPPVIPGTVDNGYTWGAAQNGNGHVHPRVIGVGQHEILRAIQKYRGVIERLEDEER